MARIAFFGAGYAGLVSGACFAELGHDVVIRDVVPERIEALRRGEVPFHEPGLEELIARNSERLSFTLSMEEAVAGSEFLFVCVGTPPTASGDANLSAVWSVIEDLPQDLDSPVLVMKSTVPVGTGEKVRAELDRRGLNQVGYASCPEFLAEGTAVRDFMQADRVVVGAFETAHGEAVAALHDRLDSPVVQMDVPSAEMVKLAANAYLATRISFINEIANVCELVGADVEDVARGMGLDQRIGTRYLRAGIGFGGSCLLGEETVLVRDAAETRLISLERLFAGLAGNLDDEVIQPAGLEVLSWRRDAPAPEFLPVTAVTSRSYEGPIVEVRTKMGRRLRCTADHPFVVSDGSGGDSRVELACDLTGADWVPIAQGAPLTRRRPRRLSLLDALPAAGLVPADVIVRPAPSELATVAVRDVRAGLDTLGHPRGPTVRAHEIVRTGAMRLSELAAVGFSLDGAALGTAKNGTYVPSAIHADERFWRIIGLYIAEGHCSQDGKRRRLQWSFHPTNELALVDEVAHFWRSLGVKADIHWLPTTTAVRVSSRLLAAWWLDVLGLGATCYTQRLPGLIWDESEDRKRALLSGLWHGDGSWSFVAGGPSVVLEYGTVSRELADGILRLLGDLGVTASLRVGRAAKSTRDTFWIRISGADQVESMLDLVSGPDADAIEASLARQQKRIAPTGYRRHDRNAAWVRVVSTERSGYSGRVYSLEVPEAHTFVTTGGLVTHNCFPKDVSFLKLLAGNSGYHFHLVSSVIEVNELQIRRPVAKVQRHLGSLRGKRVALLGLAFKPDTDDVREAPSRVLAARFLAEGAQVVAWDPVVDGREILHGVELADSAEAALAGADAAVVVTEWPELLELPWAELRSSMRTPLVIDGRNHLDPDTMRAAGYAYEGMGRAGSPFAALAETEEPGSKIPQQ